MRNKHGRGRLYEDVFADSRLLSCHCRRARCWLFSAGTSIRLDINEGRTYKSEFKDDAERRAQDDGIFNRTQLLNCGYFMLGRYAVSLPAQSTSSPPLDLAEDHAGVPLKTSDAVVPYRETLYVKAMHVGEELTKAIEDGKVNSFDYFKILARLLVDEFGWDVADARKIWVLDPDTTGPNVSHILTLSLLPILAEHARIVNIVSHAHYEFTPADHEASDPDMHAMASSTKTARDSRSPVRCGSTPAPRHCKPQVRAEEDRLAQLPAGSVFLPATILNACTDGTLAGFVASTIWEEQPETQDHGTEKLRATLGHTEEDRRYPGVVG
ncbi:hypothetical protein B0H11DRAFT_2409124 [Mycena galericulata]|nr:hypothetical protein B0H11DRAFT_2409124 [Mycena galericulata]